MTEEHHIILVMHVYTTNDIWTRPERLLRLDAFIRSGGGAGSSTVGGGGGAAVLLERIPLHDIPASSAVLVGAGGTAGGDGGASQFMDVVVPGGLGGLNGGAGGLVAGMRGGRGGTAGEDGESITNAPFSLLSGAGGGAGSGSRTGGRSGLVPPNTSAPSLWEWAQTGSGGNTGSPGGFPSGGGGAGASGAAGCVTILEYLREEI
ncbi:hypothetical protein [Nocardia puris]|uniref:hypothetical protein n=1 Tax=Nocardia puris TaxID=208602 RepID=UPI002E1E06D3